MRSKVEERLEAARYKRLLLQNQGRFSVPSDVGNAVIVISRAAERYSPASYYEQQRVLKRHAQELKSDLMTHHGFRSRDVQTIYGVTRRDIRGFMRDDRVTDMYFLSRGGYGVIPRESWIGSKVLTALDLSNYSNHLKRGIVEHRIYGEEPQIDARCINLGAYVVSDFENARTFTGFKAEEVDLDAVFRPVLDQSEINDNKLD